MNIGKESLITLSGLRTDRLSEKHKISVQVAGVVDWKNKAEDNVS